MFGIGTGELLVLFVLVLLIYGPQKLPELAAKIGKFTRDARDALEDVKSAINQPKEEVKKWGQDMMIPPPVPTDDEKADAEDQNAFHDDRYPENHESEETKTEIEKETKKDPGKDNESGS